MGYRSEVAIKCEAKAYERFARVINREDLYIKPDKILHDSANDEYCLYWSRTKWYEDFDDGVSGIVQVMSDLHEEHNCDSGDELGYRFLRIGEDYCDVEIKANDYLELCMSRKVDIPADWEQIDR